VSSGRWYRRFLWAGAALALVVIVLGAYVRLSDAGLGCPDWPGCYGHLVLPADELRRTAAEAAFPERPLEPGKAWREMIHRYAASTLGLLIIGVAVSAWLNRRAPGQPVGVPFALLAVVIFQGLLGMWTVTLLLKPLIVMGHLLGGLTTLALVAWLLLTEARRERRRARSPDRPSRQVPWFAVAGLVVLVGQIALGGWTSANYAALACPDVPTCQGEWWPPEANFAEGFVMWRGLGQNYEFGVLDAPSRVAIHFTHRLGAVLTLLLLVTLSLRTISRASQRTQRRAGQLLLAAVLLQLSIGIGVVWFGLPLSLATAHNAGAALLLLAMLNLVHATSYRAPARASVIASAEAPAGGLRA
jgi:cytochrome c oxidase assembly protein subunit 15